MLSPFDDYPIHQTSQPIAHPATAAADHYDRYFFNGHAADGSVFFGGAMGHYPNRGVIDGAFSVIVDGVQHSVFASGLIPLDRSTEVGPVRVEVIEPLRVLRLVVADNDHGVSADVVFRARTAAIEEPRQTIQRGTVQVMDYTRLTQWGEWSGQVTVDGTRIDLDPAAVRGTRDRSWGVRGVGDPVVTNYPGREPQIFWLWAPLHFDDRCTHLALFEHADGERWLESALIVPALDSPDAPTFGEERPGEEMVGVDYELTWQPGTREMATAEVTLHGPAGNEHIIDFEPLYTFRMRGIGYTHPHWKHGSNHGTLEVGGEAVALADVDPADWSNIHVQTLCRVTMGERTGMGVLEQLAFGPHAPTGLTGLVDGYQPS